VANRNPRDLFNTLGGGRTWLQKGHPIYATGGPGVRKGATGETVLGLGRFGGAAQSTETRHRLKQPVLKQDQKGMEWSVLHTAYAEMQVRKNQGPKGTLIATASGRRRVMSTKTYGEKPALLTSERDAQHRGEVIYLQT